MSVVRAIRSMIARCVPAVVLVLCWTGVARSNPDDAGARSWSGEQSARPAARGYPLGRSLSPITPEIAEGLREIARSHARRDDVFAKVGDSMSQSRAFLTCFVGDDVDLDDWEHLRETIEAFRRGNAGGVDPFSRDSEATEVGWRAISVLRGPLDRELRETHPRFATLMFGTNDMQSGRPWIFARRMWRIVDRLVENGTIPVMSSILPRGDDPRRDRDVPLYSLVARALAEGHGLPFLDYHREMERLPRRGLAADGLHANVEVRGGRSYPCDFTARGLEHGHNVRNLLHIRMLHRLRRVVLEGEPAPDPSWPEERGQGTADEPWVIDRLPYTALRRAGEAPHVYRLVLRAKSQVHVRAFVRRGSPAEVRLRPEEGDPRAEHGRAGLHARLPAGRHRLVVAPPPTSPNEYMLIVDRVPPPPLRHNPFEDPGT